MQLADSLPHEEYTGRYWRYDNRRIDSRLALKSWSTIRTAVASNKRSE